MSRGENNDSAVSVGVNSALIEPSNYSEASLQLLKSSSWLLLRATSIIGQMVAKRVILSQQNQDVMVAFSGIAALEDFIFIMTFESLGYISTRVGQTAGELPFDPTKIGALFRSGLLFAAGLTVMVGVLCVSAPLIYRVAEQPDIVTDSSGPYFRAAFFAYLFDSFYRAEVRMMVGLTKLIPPLVADISQGVLDVVLTYAFVMKLGMGVRGSAWAYALSALITLIGFTTYLFFKSDLKQYELFHFSKGITDCRKMVSKGLQIGSGATVEYVAQFLITLYCGLSGPAALLGMQAAFVCGLTVSFPVSAIVEAGSVKTANYFERKNSTYRLFGNMTLIFSAVYSIFCFLVLNYFSASFAGLFINRQQFSNEYFQIITQFIRIQSGIELLNSVRTSSAAILSACDETGFSFSVSLAFVFFLNSMFATAMQFALKKEATTTYSTQLLGFIFSAMAIATAWHQQNKNSCNPFTQGFKKVNSYLNLFWEKSPVTQSESPRNAAVDEEIQVVAQC